jgi:site-specific DNA recombinase
VAGWIAETQAERKRALEEFAKTTPSPASPLRLTPDEITALIDDLGDLVITLKDVEPDHKFEVYRALQLKLIYEPETETVRAYVDLDQHRGVWVVSEDRHRPGVHDRVR